MPTIYDVARTAAVSPKTVSRVLNGEGPVGKKTRRAVEEAMTSLDYVPSFAARTMRTNRTGLVGLVTAAVSGVPVQPDNAGLPEIFIVQGLQVTLRRAGLVPLIADTGGDFGRVADLMRMFAEHRVEGLVYVAPYHQTVSLPDVPGIEHVVIANAFDERGTPSVVPDDRLGQRRLVEGLVRRGHRRIGYITLRPNLPATKLRLQGYREALEVNGIDHDTRLVMHGERDHLPFEAMEGHLNDALEALLDLDDRPTVICTGNDLMAMRMYGMLQSRQMRVPEDISVAGYDNHAQVAEMLYPPLTTAELPYAEIGVKAAELVIASLKGTASLEGVNPRPIAGKAFWRSSVMDRRTPSSR